jgi:1-acyl-sn-glycerol-3-phosphate acyltransferase
MRLFTSILIWIAIILLILFWLPLLFLTRMFDWDPVRYRTGRMFRRMGLLISKINPNWNVRIEGAVKINDREPYVIVSNHLSNADIPVISNLPWEMKWVAKKELFKLPVLGWMMKIAGDISVDRRSLQKRAGVFKKCKYYLDRNISVMFFPEGTRSRTGKLNRFAPGAFDLAVRENIPILPLVLDGTQGCLPKNSWKFEQDVYVKLKVLDPVDPEKLSITNADDLMNDVRTRIATQLAEWRNVPLSEVDALADR